MNTRMKRPNIIFYFSDQQRGDTLGCYGQKLDVTPNLDQMAQEGTRFEYAFTTQPVCGPARACLQSGQYPTQVGCHTNAIALPTDIKTIAHYFNEVGYETAYVGKWHLASDKAKGIHHEITAVPKAYRGGYKDYWMASDVLEFTSEGYNGYVYDKDNNKVEFIGYRADCINNFAIDYLHKRDKNKPFFLFISQIEPHHQNGNNRYEGPDGSKQKFKDYEVPGDLIGTKGDWKENYPDYLGCCHSLDENVGRLRNTLKDLGIEDETIIFYTSDHGSHFKTRNGEYKRACHEGCIRIPMIAYGPGFTGGNVIKELVSLIDIPTTLLDCAGIDKPDNFQGSSLKKLVNERVEDWPKEVFLQISESQIGRAIRTHEWKYSVRGEGDGWSSPDAEVYYEEFLYNLIDDSHEKYNLVNDEQYEEVRESLKALLQKKIAYIEGKKITIRPCK